MSNESEGGMPVLHTTAELAENQALLTCLQLVRILSDEHADPAARLDALMEARESLGVSWAQEAKVRDLRELLNLLITGSDLLFPQLDPSPLLLQEGAGFAPSPYALELMTLAEDESSPARHRRAFSSIRATLQKMKDGGAAQRLYVAFRRFLIEHPVTDRVTAFDHLSRVERTIDWQIFYQAFPPQRRLVEGDLDQYFPCPRCRWPLRLIEDRLECEGPDCRAAGAIFDLTPGGRIQIVGGMEKPERLPHRPDLVMATPLTWQRYCLPGIFESRLAALVGPLVEGMELWPELDSVDLCLRVSGKDIRVDVKSGQAANLMILDLNTAAPGGQVHVIVPDERSSVAEALREALRDGRLHPHYIPRTQSAFVKWLQGEIEGGADAAQR